MCSWQAWAVRLWVEAYMMISLAVSCAQHGSLAPPTASQLHPLAAGGSVSTSLQLCTARQHAGQMHRLDKCKACLVPPHLIRY